MKFLKTVFTVLLVLIVGVCLLGLVREGRQHHFAYRRAVAAVQSRYHTESPRVQRLVASTTKDEPQEVVLAEAVAQPSAGSISAFPDGTTECNVPAFVVNPGLIPMAKKEVAQASVNPVPVVPDDSVDLTNALRVSSDWKVDPELARDDLGRKLQARLSELLTPAGVSPGWKPPVELLDQVVCTEPAIESEERDYARLFRASQLVKLTPDVEHTLVSAYRRQRAGLWLGAALFGILASLAILSVYIRLEEATRGYYTTLIRTAAVSGLMVAGVFLIKWLRMAA